MPLSEASVKAICENTLTIIPQVACLNSEDWYSSQNLQKGVGRMPRTEIIFFLEKSSGEKKYSENTY